MKREKDKNIYTKERQTEIERHRMSESYSIVYFFENIY